MAGGSHGKALSMNALAFRMSKRTLKDLAEKSVTRPIFLCGQFFFFLICFSMQDLNLLGI